MDLTRSDAPADTRMMGIVHEALRRDLRRTRAALGATPPPDGDRRASIGRHVEWMMQFLHHHHHAEDEGLYPLVRERNPETADLLDEMDADHQAIAPAIAGVESAAAAYRHGDDDGASLVAALDDLEEDLLPHLLREEEEMMPVVSATLTQAELHRWDQEHNVKPKSLAQLGREGHWILDGLGPDERDLVVHLVPPLPRFVLLRGFARPYRRHLARCWGQPSPSPRRIHKRGRTEVTVAAEPRAVWEVVADVTRVGEWSHECRGAEWVGGATAAVPGARFRGRNRHGIFRWGRVSEVVEAAPFELAWRTVPSILYPISTEWRIRLHEADGGTRIEQTFRVLEAPKILDVVYATLLPSHRDRTEALQADLLRLGAVAAPPPPSLL